jgi:hypothetical protein
LCEGKTNLIIFFSPSTLQGFTPELLSILNESSQHTGDHQMKFLLEEMLKRKEVTAADVLSRVNFVITGLLFHLNLLFVRRRLLFVRSLSGVFGREFRQTLTQESFITYLGKGMEGNERKIWGRKLGKIGRF